MVRHFREINEDLNMLSVGAVYEFIEGANINLEYISLDIDDAEASVITAGAEYNINNVMLFARYEVVDIDDLPPGVDNDDTFISGGVGYSPAENYTLLLEVSNFNSTNRATALNNMLYLAEDSQEDAILLGVKAAF